MLKVTMIRCFVDQAESCKPPEPTTPEPLLKPPTKPSPQLSPILNKAGEKGRNRFHRQEEKSMPRTELAGSSSSAMTDTDPSTMPVVASSMMPCDKGMISTVGGAKTVQTEASSFASVTPLEERESGGQLVKKPSLLSRSSLLKRRSLFNASPVGIGIKPAAVPAVKRTGEERLFAPSGYSTPKGRGCLVVEFTEK